MDILQKLTQEFSVKLWQVENAVNLIDDGNTIPFIARYRKEATGSLDDQLLRDLSRQAHIFAKYGGAKGKNNCFN